LASASELDDPSIPDSEALLRRIKAFKNWISPGGRPTSVAFKDNTPDGRLSVHRSSLTTVDWVCGTYPDYGVWSVLAGVPRAFEHGVVGAPTDADPSHAVVVALPSASISKRMEAARRMAAASEMLRPIP